MCIFCKIIEKEIPAEIVYEDQDVIAILDLEPLTKGHTLVIPKKHFKNLLDVEVETLDKVMHVAKKLAKDYMDKYQMKGFNLVINNNQEAFQSVDHLHVHIIPRYKQNELEYFKKAD